MKLIRRLEEGQREFVGRVICARLDALGHEKIAVAKLPDVMLPDSVLKLRDTPELSFEVRGTQFLFRALLLSLIERTDGKNIEPKEMDEFVIRTRERNGIMPESVRIKQRYQLWPMGSVLAFAANVVATMESNDARESKISYKFVPDVSVGHLLSLNQALLDEFCGATISE